MDSRDYTYGSKEILGREPALAEARKKVFIARHMLQITETSKEKRKEEKQL